MDIQMPDMDGLEAARRIRALEKPGEAHIPIVAMTACAMKGDREKCLEAGFDSYISKPIQVAALDDALVQYARPCAG
jgi:CheY-like chemotaxis protein